MLSRVTDGTELHFGRTRGDTDDHTECGGEKMTAGAHHLDESAHHQLAGVEVGDDTVAQRAYHMYLVVGLLVHELCRRLSSFRYEGQVQLLMAR